MKKREQLHFCLFVCTLFLVACSTAKQIKTSAKANVLNAPSLTTAHVGISIFDATENKYLYNYQGDKYFVPASNIKIATCYAAMKYLGDSLVGLQYFETDSLLYIKPSGDPTLLHREFKTQPVVSFLSAQKKPIAYADANWQSELYGAGWTWNDYGEAYMVERNPLPLYGNFIRFGLKKINGKTELESDVPFFKLAVRQTTDSATNKIAVSRRRFENVYDVTPAAAEFRAAEIPFITLENTRLLSDTLKKTVLKKEAPTNVLYTKLYTQPTDSLLKPMMHRSDNFFAEQTLLMVSNEVLGVMNDAKITDTILKTVFKDLPQKPRWVDGSGLSRYNLFSPQDFVAILNKMKNEFGMARIKEVFATGGEGTISSYYKKDSSFLYAKTGTLSGVVALSGFMYTAKNKLFLFSVLVNNHQASSTEVRRAVEKFIQDVRKRY